jgi:uncharacterized protein (UPF0303 family)
MSNCFLLVKIGGDEDAFAKQYEMGEKASKYALRGAGIPIRVVNVDSVVAVVVMNNLGTEEEDFMMAAVALEAMKMRLEGRAQ